MISRFRPPFVPSVSVTEKYRSFNSSIFDLILAANGITGTTAYTLYTQNLNYKGTLTGTITNYIVSGITIPDPGITATTFVVVSNYTITPGAGTYMATFTSQGYYAGPNLCPIAMYANGLQLTNTYRDINNNTTGNVSMNTMVTVSDGQAI